MGKKQNYQAKYHPEWFQKMTEKIKPDRVLKWDSYKQWYSNLSIRYKMFPYLRDREFALLIPKCSSHEYFRSTRFLKLTNVQSFDFFFKVTGMNDNETKYGFFYSMAKYENGIPFVPYNKEKRDIAKAKWINNHWKEMISYDFYIDIDGELPIFHLVKESAHLLINFFKNHQFPFKLRYSGKGFHFVTDYENIKNFIPLKWNDFNPNAEHNIYRFYGLIAKWLSATISELIDLGIYDARRVLKIPYSLAIYKDDTFVCFPISKIEEFKKFEPWKVNIKNFKLSKIPQHEEDFESAGNKNNPEILIKRFCREVGI